MEKPIIFNGLDDFKIPKCDVKIVEDYDMNGNLFRTFLIKIQKGDYIHYKNDKKYGVVPDTLPKKDIICALMELGDSPSADTISHYFNNYGFFLSHEHLQIDVYERYTETDIIDYIRFLQNIIKLTNYYSIYVSLPESNNKLNYTEICNLFIGTLFSGKHILNQCGIAENNIESLQTIIGFRFLDDYNNCIKKYEWPSRRGIYEAYPMSDEGDYEPDLIGDYEPDLIGYYTVEPFEDYLSYCNSDIIDGEYYVYNNIGNINRVTSDKLTYYGDERKITEFLWKLSNCKKLIYPDNIDSYDIDYTDCEEFYGRVPRVIELNNTDSNTIELQNELMNAVQISINIIMNEVIQYIYPVIHTEEHSSTSYITWNFKNIIFVIFMELVNIKIDKFECRACCKEDCPKKGSYYYIADAKNTLKTCYEKACRSRMNKHLFDYRSKE